jgi:hypothetical protein
VAISVTHAFVSGVADGADATLVRPSNWNAALVTSMATGKLLGRTTAAAGSFEEITPSADLTFTGGNLGIAVPAMTLGQVLALHNGMPLP